VGVKDFRDLNIWNRGISLVEQIYRITRAFPQEEQYCLTSQLRRASVSVPSNIAEGFARHSNKEYKQFLYISLGSCAELTTQIIISQRLGYLGEGESEQLQKDVNTLSKMIMSLIKKIK
jgi:four helix bundle protein